MLEVDGVAVQVVARRQSGLEDEHGRGRLGQDDTVKLRVLQTCQRIAPIDPGRGRTVYVADPQGMATGGASAEFLDALLVDQRSGLDAV